MRRRRKFQEVRLGVRPESPSLANEAATPFVCVPCASTMRQACCPKSTFHFNVKLQSLYNQASTHPFAGYSFDCTC